MKSEEYHDDAVARAYTLWRITGKRRHARKWQNRVQKGAHAAFLAGRKTAPFAGRPAVNRREWKMSRADRRLLNSINKQTGGTWT